MTNGATQAAAPDTEPARSRRRCRGLALTAGLRLEARFDGPDLFGQLRRKGKAAHFIPADQAVACTLLYIGPGQRLPDELPSRCVALNDGEASARQIAVRGGTVGYGYNRNSMAICVPADLCASDLQIGFAVARLHAGNYLNIVEHLYARFPLRQLNRSEEHTSELQSLMRISYAVFCLKTTTTNITRKIH